MARFFVHPILDVPTTEKHFFTYQGKPVETMKGQTIAAALHNAGYPVHSHSLKNRNRSLECGIGKCGACEMLVDGKIKRICITLVDGVSEVSEIPKNYIPESEIFNAQERNMYLTDVAIIGAGPAGLAAREILNEHGISNIVIDSNHTIGGQFMMQTHQFFFFEKEHRYGGMRGFEIAKQLAGDSTNGIFLNSTVWDIFQGKIIAAKNIRTGEFFYVKAEYLVIATGAIPFIPPFENDDLPGVYTAAVIQKMMNLEYTLLGKKILTVGAGNIGYLTSYQLTQAGAQVVAIIEARDQEGGFPVQANRIKRLGIPILLNHMLVKAIPNEDKSGIIGAVIAECKNFQPIPGTEKKLMGIDAINICTGLVPDNQLLTLGEEIFGKKCLGGGDAIRIGEGTSAVLRGKQIAYEILDMMGKKYNYDTYLAISKEYLDSQQHPIKILDDPIMPDEERMKKPFVILDCTYGFACNPCVFVCPHKAISKSSTSTVPVVDYNKCTGCMACVYQCPGLAIFGYNIQTSTIFFPVELFVDEGVDVYLVDNDGKIVGEGVVEKILKKPNKTNIARVRSTTLHGEKLTKARGFIPKNRFPERLIFEPGETFIQEETFICHCEDVTYEEIKNAIGDRKYISIDEIKHTTRLGMGACRGKRCFQRLKTLAAADGITIVGAPTPRGPLSNQIFFGELQKPLQTRIVPYNICKKIPIVETKVLIAGGGIAGSALFRYFSEAGFNPILINYQHGSSWRNIAGGRPVFSIPELSEIALRNKEIFIELQKIKNINFKPIRYISFAHDEDTFKALDASRAWSNAIMIEPKDFVKYISPYFNPHLHTYLGALITEDCWQANPGKVVDLIRTIGLAHGGQLLEDTRLISVEKENDQVIALVRNHFGNYMKYKAQHFVNALGSEARTFALQLGIDPGIYPVRHQAFITRSLPMLGYHDENLDMLIDRRIFKGFSAIYGQQLKETGQIIGCASPVLDPDETNQNLKINTIDFIEAISEVFTQWIPSLKSVQFQAIWGGYYVEPRYIVDPELGLFIGLRGHGFMLAQYLAKLYVDAFLNKEVPSYFKELKLSGKGLQEKSFK
ncbi:MAG: FAD-dependent oxidoreductase [Bacteroidales bacterium]|nr:FAD-dependent oxidoreductase [Bacteroidales bacterium]